MMATLVKTKSLADLGEIRKTLRNQAREAAQQAARLQPRNAILPVIVRIRHGCRTISTINRRTR